MKENVRTPFFQQADQPPEYYLSEIKTEEMIGLKNHLTDNHYSLGCINFDKAVVNPHQIQRS